MYRVRTLFTGGIGAPYLNTLYFDDTGGLTAANANADVGTFWNAVKSVIQNTYTFATQPQVDHIDPATGHITSSVAVTPVTATCTGSSDQLPPANNGLVQIHTGNYPAGREVRGRIFIPGPGEISSTNGVPTAAYISTVGTAAAALQASVISDLIVWSKKNGVFETASSTAVWATWAVLRSRRS